MTSLHPGVTFEEVQGATGFPLLRVDNLGDTPGPTEEQLAIIRHLDPHNIRASILKDNPPGLRAALGMMIVRNENNLAPRGRGRRRSLAGVRELWPLSRCIHSVVTAERAPLTRSAKARSDLSPEGSRPNNGATRGTEKT